MSQINTNQQSPPRNRSSQPEANCRDESHDETQHACISWEQVASGNEECMDALVERLGQMPVPPVIELSELPLTNDGQRDRLIDFLRRLCGRFSVVVLDHGTRRPYEGIYEAALGHLVRPVDDAARAEQSRRLLIEAAVLCHADQPEAAANQIVAALRAIGWHGVTLKSILSDLRGGVPDENKKPSAYEIAQRYLQHECERLGIEEWSLRFWQERFWSFNSQIWRPLGSAEVVHDVAAFMQQNGLGDHTRTSLLRDIEVNLAAMVKFETDQHQPMWLPVAEGEEVVASPYWSMSNGLLDLSNAIAGDEAIRDFSWRHFSIVQLPYAFDREAECPAWRRSIEQWLPEEETPPEEAPDNRQRVLQELAGYCLLPGLWLQKAVILYGQGGEGKSAFLEVLKAVLGDANVSSVPINKLADRFVTAQMHGKLANISADLERIDKVDEGHFKKLVSGDLVMAEHKYKPPFSMRPTAVQIFSANSLPSFSDRTNGIWRRLHIIEFKQVFDGGSENCNLASELIRDELPGILRWAIEGARRLLVQRAFTPCGVCVRAHARYRRTTDNVAQFLDERCEKGEFEVVKDELFTAYKKFCLAAATKPLSKPNFSVVLENRGIGSRRDTVGARLYYYVGVRISPCCENIDSTATNSHGQWSS